MPDEKDYDEAFDEFMGEGAQEEPAPEPKPEEVPEEVHEEPSADATEQVDDTREIEDNKDQVDIWAEAPDALRDAFEEQARIAKELEHKNKSAVGRVSALQRQINELSAAQQAALQTQPPSEAATDTTDDSTLEQKLTELDQDMPEIARDVRAIIQAEIARGVSQAEEKITAKVDSRIQPIVADRQEQAESQEYASLLEAHPDFEEIAQDQGYWEWFNLQPIGIQNLMNSDYAAEVSAGLDLYKSATGRQETKAPEQTVTSNKRKTQIEAAQSIPSRASRASAPNADDDYDAAWNHFAK